MKFHFYLRGTMILVFFLAWQLGFAQMTVTGTVTDATSGEALIGATIMVEGTSTGTITDFDGKYSLNVPADDATVLRFSYTGYSEKSIAVYGQQVINVLLVPGEFLDEVVVIGYGTTQTKDLTGSVVSVNSEDFQKGNVATPEQLVVGKIAGVKITSNSGAPGAGSRIRIRGGTSLNASNDPLIVLDGVPLDNNKISGAANALNLINPSEIESITVLKDASAAAIYGARAANGVILITTKKGKQGERFSVNLSTTNSYSTIPKLVDVLSADEFRTIVTENGTEDQIALLGTESTDWQKEIYRNAFSTQNNLTFAGGIEALPYRLNMEYTHNAGILQRSEMDRYGASLNLSPTFLDGQIKVDINGKYARTENFFADEGAIGTAVSFDPTKPVFSGVDDYGGYYEWVGNNGNPNPLAPRNPVGLLYQKEDKSSVNRFLGNAKVDYSPDYLPGFTATLNVGMDMARASGTVFIPAEAASDFNRGGKDNYYEQQKDNKLLEVYGNYQKDLPGIDSRFDVTAGYSYQNWFRNSPAQPELNVAGDTIEAAGIDFQTENTLISFYGRLNYNLKERYLLTMTLREDGSSRFSPDTRWGLFPSVALAWRISEESFMENSNVYMKLRAGWGVTGQQDIGVDDNGNDYPYIPNYDLGTLTAQYQFGDVFYTVLRPDGYDANIKWEETTSYNIGLDLGFMNNRLNAAIDVYQKTTKDLLAIIPVAAGTNFTNQIFTNVGSLENKGIELSLNYVAIDHTDFTLEFNGNVSYNSNVITQLTKSEELTDPGILIGSIPGGVGNTIQIHTVGYSAYSFLVYEQAYENGKPLEDEYVDLDGVAGITPGRSDLDLGDQYIFDGSPEPTVFTGFSTYLTYKKWNASFTLRGEFGQYIYNGVAAQRGYFNGIDPQSSTYLQNLTTAYYESEFVDGDVTQFLSDYYLEKGDFVRMDNITLGYNFGEIANNVFLRLGASVQNAFVISNYSGIDPEVIDGRDDRLYPRPRIFSLNLNLSL
ncbi:MAG: SusC/RagA family TonB-linked outer membrane protein [Saprospiraceae bacterium]|nr:SusC/RagA family TonB-linked outer membrane protein [Saprospiraceae bacterium]